MLKISLLFLALYTSSLLILEVEARTDLSVPFLKRLRNITHAEEKNPLQPMSGSGSGSFLGITDICNYETLQDTLNRMRDMDIHCPTQIEFENCCQAKFFALQMSFTFQSSPSIFPVILHKRLRLAYCDMNTAGGGWMVIYSGGYNYKRWQGLLWVSKFRRYEFGFGKFQRDFWLGLVHVHHYTKNDAELLVELVKNGTKYFAHYDHFSVASKSQGYKIHIGGYRRESTLPDSLSHNNGFNFSSDHRNPAVAKQYNKISCFHVYADRWWHGQRGNESCTRVSLIRNYNAPGPYGAPGPSKLLWEVNGEKVGFETGTMKIRPKKWECGNLPPYTDTVRQKSYLSAAYPDLNPFYPPPDTAVDKNN